MSHFINIYQLNVFFHDFSTVTDQVRWGCFQKSIPRKEIDAIWAIFAFVARPVPTSISLPTSTLRWRIVSVLFSSDAGVFPTQNRTRMTSKEKSSIENPIFAPDPEHLKALVDEINYLTQMIRTGAMDPMPESGNILKIIQKSISLEAENYRKNSRDVFYMRHGGIQRYPKFDRNNITELWLLSDLLSDMPCGNISKELIKQLYPTSSQTKEKKTVFSLLSDSMVVNSCSALISAWILKNPNKKAKWVRFKESFSKLLSFFESEMSRLEIRSNEDYGQNALGERSTENYVPREGFEQLLSVLLYRDAYVSLLLAVVDSRLKYTKSVGCPIGLSIGNLDQGLFDSVRLMLLSYVKPIREYKLMLDTQIMTQYAYISLTSRSFQHRFCRSFHFHFPKIQDFQYRRYLCTGMYVLLTISNLSLTWRET